MAAARAERHPLSVMRGLSQMPLHLIELRAELGAWPHELEQQALMMPDSLHLHHIAIQKSVIAGLACAGTPVHVMCIFLRMSEAEFRKIFQDTIDNAATIVNGRVMGSLLNTALYEGDPRARTTAAIFWLKCRAQWREDGKTVGTHDPNAAEALGQLANFTDEELEQIEAIVKLAKKRDHNTANNPQRLIEHDPQEQSSPASEVGKQPHSTSPSSQRRDKAKSAVAAPKKGGKRK